jgi:Tfp pilus assembly protein FimV
MSTFTVAARRTTRAPRTSSRRGVATVRAARSTAPLRLTRRGRLFLVLAIMTLLVVVGVVLGQGSSQAAGRGSGAATSRTLTVKPGETLWSVAARIAPHSDPRLVVADIESRNHLVGAELRAGQQLVVPRVR